MANFLEDTSLSASAKEPPEINLNFGDQDETQEQAAEKYDGLSREEAVHYFLPKTTLHTAGGDLNALIQIARLIKPAVSRITNEMRKTN